MKTSELMRINELKKAVDPREIGGQIHRLVEDLYPICRSITGNGMRQTLGMIQGIIPLHVHEVPTGTRVLDWTVPREWNIRDAYVKNLKGERVVDFRKSNLHVVSYSVPVRRRMFLAELKEHLFTLPARPEWVPYRTSYYDEFWGFCLSHNQFEALTDGEYEVCIDADLEDGFLTFGEYYLPGESHEEVLISCHTCHPSLCNDNLSGVAVATYLAKHLSRVSRRYSYRFLFIPGTIGSITWLALNEEKLPGIRHGFVLACVGDLGRSTYKKSRRGDAEIDRAAIHALKHSGADYEVVEFHPYGYDERQFCSPGFNLPVGCLMRTPYGRFPEYHTSADDLNLVRPEGLGDSFAKCLALIEVLERNKTYLNLSPKGEPQLGRRGLYRTIGGQTDTKAKELAVLWVLNLSDGAHSLLDIAERASLEFGVVADAAGALLDHGLLVEAQPQLDGSIDG